MADRKSMSTANGQKIETAGTRRSLPSTILVSRTAPWLRTRRWVERSSDIEQLPLRPFSRDCIIATRGYDFWKGQAAHYAFEMLDYLVDMHHVGIFVVQVEEIDLVAQHRAVIGAFLDHDVVEAVGMGIDRAGAHAARRALAEDDQAICADLAQMRDQRRAEETRGALLVDDEFPRHGRELLLDVIEFLRLLAHPAMRRAHAIGVGMARGVDHRQARRARGSQQRPRRLDRLPGVLATGARVAPIDLTHRAISARICLVVEIDRQHRGIASRADLAAIGLVELEDFLVDDVLPAMILKIAWHGNLPIRAARCG